MHPTQPAFEIICPDGQGPVVLVCEHASCVIPPEFDNLGLDDPALGSHAAWDIGARDLAVALSALFEAPLVAGGVSRLVYDLNRPLEAASAIPEVSEIFEIPGNQGLTDDARQARFDAYHLPFHQALADVLDARAPSAMITVHSFTPVYNGVSRPVEIGYLHDKSADLAKAALAVEQAQGHYLAALNEPYAATDGVTYTLAKHGEVNGIPALMIEVRNDLIDTPETAQAMAQHLHGVLSAALTAMVQQKEVAK